MTILIIIAAYILLLWNCKILYSNKSSDKKYTLEIEYQGLLWVGLDNWTIWRYESNNEPIKWIKWKRSFDNQNK